MSNSDLVFSVTVFCTRSIEVLARNLPASSQYTIDSKHLNTLPLTQATFVQKPAECAVGTFSYELTDTSGTVIAKPDFFSAFSNSAVTVASTDVSHKGTNDYKIKVTDSLTGLQNNEVQFSVVLKVKVYATSMALVAGSLIPDQRYYITSSKISLTVPSYSFEPSDAVLNVQYSLVG